MLFLGHFIKFLGRPKGPFPWNIGNVVSGGPSDDSSVTCATLHPCHHYHQMIVLDVMFPNLLRTYVQHAAQVLDVMFPNLLRTYV
jgi:hypothetical protein